MSSKFVKVRLWSIIQVHLRDLNMLRSKIVLQSSEIISGSFQVVNLVVSPNFLEKIWFVAGTVNDILYFFTWKT